jgi:hypothetical protein
MHHIFDAFNDDECYEILEFLLENNADPNIKNKDGCRVLSIAKKLECPKKTIKLIKSHGGIE